MTLVEFAHERGFFAMPSPTTGETIWYKPEVNTKAYRDSKVQFEQRGSVVNVPCRRVRFSILTHRKMYELYLDKLSELGLK